MPRGPRHHLLLHRAPPGQAALGQPGVGPPLSDAEAPSDPGGGGSLRPGDAPLHLRHGPGTDLYFAEAVLALRLCRSGVTLEAARPCESQADAWPEAEQHRYQAILDQCDFETLVQHRYDRFCMQRRNRYMVDRSALVLSVYDGVPKGGTAQTLAYAMRQGVPVQILDPEQGD